MLALVGRSLFKSIKGIQVLNPRNRRLALFTIIAVMLGSVATLVIVHSERIGCLQWQVWFESCR